MIGKNDISFSCKFDILYFFGENKAIYRPSTWQKKALKGGISCIIRYVDIPNKNMIFLLIGNNLPLTNIELFKHHITNASQLQNINFLHFRIKVSDLTFINIDFQKHH